MELPPEEEREKVEKIEKITEHHADTEHGEE
jgi:hypothetical protein